VVTPILSNGAIRCSSPPGYLIFPNFFDALDFVNLVIQFGTDKAIKKHGGFKNIRCLMRNVEAARVFEFESVFELETKTQKTETLTFFRAIFCRVGKFFSCPPVSLEKLSLCPCRVYTLTYWLFFFKEGMNCYGTKIQNFNDRR